MAPEPRIQDYMAEERGDALRRKDRQGRVEQCLKNAPASSHYLFTGGLLVLCGLVVRPQRRHDSIIDRIERTASQRGWSVIGKNTRVVEGSNLRPDLVLSKGDACRILDVTVTFENCQEAFECARKEKQDKYAAIKTALEEKFKKVTIAPILVGALGTWDPLNNKHLRGLLREDGEADGLQNPQLVLVHVYGALKWKNSAAGQMGPAHQDSAVGLSIPKTN